jgi:CBS domain-containing protein
MSPQDNIQCVLDYKGGQIWSIGPDATVYEAIERMAEREIGCMPVLDEAGGLLGLISERDYARKIILQGRSSRDTAVREIMSSPVIYVSPQDTVEHCMHVMTDARVRHLPVVDRSRLVGIVSIGDLVNWIISSHEEAIEHLKSYISGSYPG